MAISGWSASNYIQRTFTGSNHFLRTNKWAFVVMFNSTDMASDDNGIVSNYPAAGTGQLRARIDQGTAPQNLEVRTGNGGALTFTGSGDYAENTWYAIMITCDGSVGAGDCYKFGATVAATPSYIDDTLNGTHNGDVTGTFLDVIIGCTRAGGNAEYFRGNLAHVGYYEGMTTVPDKTDFENYIDNPYTFYNDHSSSCIYQLDTSSITGSTTVEDRSSNNNDFTVTGTLSTATSDPVTWDAGGGGITVPLFVNSYRQRRQ